MNSFFFIAFSFLIIPISLISQESSPLVLNLEKAISRALSYNRSLMNAEDKVTQATFSLEAAEDEFSIQISPVTQTSYGGGILGTGLTLGGGLEISKKFPSGTQISFTPSLTKTPNQYITGLNVGISQPIFRGLSQEYQLSGVRAAAFSLKTSEIGFYISQIQLILKTISNFYEILKAQKELLLSEESENRIKTFYQAAKLKEKIGMQETTSLDVYRAEIELKTAKDNLTSAQEKLQEAEDALRDTLALPVDILLHLEAPIDYTSNTINLETGIKLALENRIEVEQAEEQLKESLRLSYIANRNLYPDINLQLTYSNLGKDKAFRRFYRCRENNWGIGITTSGFNPAKDRITYEKSLLAIESAERNLEQVKCNLILEVKKNLRQIERLDKRILLQEELISTAHNELRLAQIKFSRGKANNFDVLQAEKSLRTAQKSYWIALIDRIVAEYQMRAALGLLVDKPKFFSNRYEKKP